MQQDSPGQAGQNGYAKVATLAAVAALLLIMAAAFYSLADLNAEVRDLRAKVARLEQGFESLDNGGLDKRLERLQADLERDFRTRLEQLADSPPEQAGRDVQEEGRSEEPALPDAVAGTGEDQELGPYSFEIIQVTQFDVQDGQEVIYTKKSNLLEFFTPERAMSIVASHMFQVWQDNYLLVIFRE